MPREPIRHAPAGRGDPEPRPTGTGRPRGPVQRPAPRGGDRQPQRGGEDRGGERRPAVSPNRPQFVYQERTVDQVRREVDRRVGRYDSIFKSEYDAFRPSAGRNTIRPLPPTWANADHWGFRVYLHKYVGADESTYVCPRKWDGSPCCICEAERDAKDAGEKDEAKLLAVKEDVIWWILDRDGDDPDKPLLYEMSAMQNKELVGLTYDPRSGEAFFPDHQDQGYDLTLTREGQGKRTRYGGYVWDRTPTPISDDLRVQDDILAFITENPIPDCLVVYDNDYLERVIYGTQDSASEPEPEPEPEPARGRSDSRRPAPAAQRGREEAPARGRTRSEPEEPAADAYGEEIDPNNPEGEGEYVEGEEPADGDIYEEPAADERPRRQPLPPRGGRTGGREPEPRAGRGREPAPPPRRATVRRPDTGAAERHTQGSGRRQYND